MIAALMPLIAGIVRDSSVSLTSAWLVMSAGVVLLIVIAFTLNPSWTCRRGECDTRIESYFRQLVR
jgi:CP family cyanate transporter-like MFS transporter